MGTSPRIPGEDRHGSRRRRAGGREPYGVAFALSAVLHLALLVLYASQGPPAGRGAASRSAPGPTPIDGTEIIRIVEVAGDALEGSPDEPVEVRTDDPDPGRIRIEAPGERVEGDLRAPPLPAAERLRTQASEGDERLWSSVDPSLVEPTPEQRARLQLLGRIEEMNDSAAAAAEAATAMTDWTYTDEEGKRWGISPGKLHLGNLTLPLPAFSAPPDPNGASTRRAWQWEDIENQAGSAAARESWKERAQEIRRRRDAERADTIGFRR